MNGSTTSLASALLKWPIWIWYGRQDIRSRYRGSLLGPLWLVLNLGILVGALSVIYGTIFGLSLRDYMPHVTTGFLVWWFIAGALTESCTAFTANAQIIRNLPLPLGIHVLRVLARQTMLVAHNFIVYVIVAVAFGIRPNLNTLLLVPGIGLLLSLLFTMGVSLAIICARYRDVPHIVASMVQVVIFVTPIVFSKEMLHGRMIIADVNPFYHMIEVVRAPLLGQAPEALTWIFLIVANAASLVFTLWLMRRAAHRVPYLV